MTNISKKPLSLEAANTIRKQLHATIGKLSAQSAPAFLKEFLGAEENIMLAKRLGAIIMCTQGASSYRIQKTLKVSPSTAAHIILQYRTGNYAHIEKCIQRNKYDLVKFATTIEKILSLGMPRRTGRGRWKSALRNLARE